jgi:heme/copper-type cytochrome/quinol oxidase subunit 2
MIIVEYAALTLMIILTLFVWFVFGVGLYLIYKSNKNNDKDSLNKYAEKIWSVLFATFLMTMVTFMTAKLISL